MLLHVPYPNPAYAGTNLFVNRLSIPIIEFPITVLIEWSPFLVFPSDVISKGKLLNVPIPVMSELHAFCLDATGETVAQYDVEIASRSRVAFLTIRITESILLPILTVET